jgi:hypothetical protein
MQPTTPVAVYNTPIGAYRALRQRVGAFRYERDEER